MPNSCCRQTTSNLRVVQKISGLDVFLDRFLVDLKTNSCWIIIGAARIRHRHHTCLQIQAVRRNRPMEIMCKGCDPAAARQMIANERNSLERAH